MKTKRKYVVVRTTNAGVHVGELVSRKGGEAKLANARRLWYWKGANTLSEVSLRGVQSGSKVSEPVEEIELIGVIEVLPATKEAEKSLRAATWQA